MRCYTVDGTGLDGLKKTERPAPGDPGPGEALVDVRAVSLNYRDLMVMDGRYGGKQDPPILAASDMAGVIVRVGKDVAEFREGDRVLNAPFRFWPAGQLRPDWMRTFSGGRGVDGVLAERIVYPAVSLVKMPAHFGFTEGATLTIAGLTAWAAVVAHGRVRAGEWALSHGTGGVSIFAMQIAKMFGARTVLTTSNPEKGRRALEKLGLDAVFDNRDASWPERVVEITGGGADVVIEVVGGPMLAKSVKASAMGARIALIGVLGGAESAILTRDILSRQATIRGIFMESAEELRALARACESSGLRPWIDRVFPFEEARAAYEYLQAQKHIGKVVIEVAGEK